VVDLTVNGEKRQFASPISVEQLLSKLQIDSKKVALERNLEIVPRSCYRDTMLKEGDRIEIVHFIGGGNRLNKSVEENIADCQLVIGTSIFNSRLIVGTGKYRDFEQTRDAVIASGADLVTVAVRRVNITDKDQPMLVDYLDPERFTYLPNTAGCYSAEDAVRTLRLAREAGGWTLVKLEVLGNSETLYPNMTETLDAAELLISEGFQVMVYCNDDPILAKRLEDMGCCAIMPLAAPIGSGLGIQNPVGIRLIVEQSKVPVIVDAGVGTASDATIAMELGCDGVLMNTAIAEASDPITMAYAMRYAIESGRLAYVAGRMQKKRYADPSSPLHGII